MAPYYHSIGTPVVPIGHTTEYVTSPIAIPPTLPPAENGPLPGSGQYPPSSLSPVPSFTEHDPEVVGPNSMTPPPAYTESNLRVIVGDSKTLPHAYDPPLSSLCNGLSPNPDEGGTSLYVGVPEEPSSLQVGVASSAPVLHWIFLINTYADTAQKLCDREPTVHGTLSPAPVPVPDYCATICTPASKYLNYHVNPDNDIYRWQTTEGSIPIGINLQSFESREQGSMVKRCLKIVLRNLNDNNVGPKFQLVKDPRRSAFSVTFAPGASHCYASSFFPGWHPKDWDIYVFKQGLTLSEEQERLLIQPRGRDVNSVRLQALEQNLIKILAHEMLHVLGVRHCVVDLNVERESYVRFPPELSDCDNWDPLMQPGVDRMDLSRLNWKSQTIKELRQIYAMNEGDTVGCHRIRDVSWRDGMRVKEQMARIHAQYFVSKRRTKSRD